MNKKVLNVKGSIVLIIFLIVLFISLNGSSYATTFEGMKSFNNAPRMVINADENKFADVEITVRDYNGIKDVKFYKANNKEKEEKPIEDKCFTKPVKNVDGKELTFKITDKYLGKKDHDFFVRIEDNTGNVLRSYFSIAAKDKCYKTNAAPRIINWSADNKGNITFNASDKKGSIVTVYDLNNKNKAIIENKEVKAGANPVTFKENQITAKNGEYRLKIHAVDMSVAKKSSTRTVNFKVKDYAAKIGDTKFETLQKAVNAVAKDNKAVTITLLNDVSFKESLKIKENQNIVLNLNGHTIKGIGPEGKISDEVKFNIDYDTIYNKGKLEIKGKGKIYSKNNQAITNGQKGELIITNGAMENGVIDKKTVITNRGIITINGGEIIGQLANRATATINGGTINATVVATVHNLSTGTLTINGGTFNSKETNTVYNDGTLEIKGDAKISSEGKNHSAIYNSDTGNVTISGGTMRGKGYVIGNHGKLTIKGDTKISNEGKASAVFNFKTGNMTISGGTISSKNDNAVWNDGKLTIKGKAKISSESKEFATVVNSEKGEMTISGGTISSKNTNMISNYGKLTIKGEAKISNEKLATVYNSEKGKMTISGGTISSKNDNAVVNDGKLTIKGDAKISNEKKATVYNGEKGEMTIGGGTISSKNDNAVWNDGKLTIKGEAKISNESKEYATVYNFKTGNIAISGGTISAKNSAVIGNEGKLTISGGTLTAKDDRVITNYGTLTISGNAKISNDSVSDYAAVYNVTGGKLTISGGTITARKYAVSSERGATLNITGGTQRGQIIRNR